MKGAAKGLLSAFLVVLSTLAFTCRAGEKRLPAPTHHEISAGVSLPVYTLLGVPLPGDLTSISPGTAVGYKWVHTPGRCFEWFLFADLYYRQLGYSGHYLDDKGTKHRLKGQSLSLPFGAGVRGLIPVGSQTALWGDLGGGLSMNFGYGNYDSYFKVQNTFSYLCNSILPDDINGSLTLFFHVDLGATVKSRYKIGLSYANFGLNDTKRRTYRQPPGSHSATFVSSEATVVLSSLALKFGYQF